MSRNKARTSAPSLLGLSKRFITPNLGEVHVNWVSSRGILASTRSLDSDFEAEDEGNAATGWEIGRRDYENGSRVEES